MAFCDIALVYDPAAHRCDCAFDGADLVLDLTPVTPILMAIGNDRRAHADDTLPDTVADPYTPPTLNGARGWCGDWMDGAGRLIGSRFWLVRGGKQNEATRKLAEAALGEGLADFSAANALAIAILVRWVARGVLGYQITAGKTQISLTASV